MIAKLQIWFLLKSIMTYDRIRWIVGGQKDGDKVNIVS